MSTNVPDTVAHGDGIGPEIMKFSLPIIPEVWPDGISETPLTDGCRCRFTAVNGRATQGQ